MNVTCRDGIMAKVMLVPYLGVDGGHVFFGWRCAPGLPRNSIDQGPDLWDLDGFWSGIRMPHDFDIEIGSIMQCIKGKLPKPSSEHARA